MEGHILSHTTTTEHGVIDAVFAHRFVLQRDDGTRMLADLGPKGPESFKLVAGQAVSIEGEVKPSEVKVTSIMTKGGERVAIAHGKPQDGSNGTPDGGDESAEALAAVRKGGFEPVGQPRRKPKHFEVLARRGDELLELHVDLDGTIRKEKQADEKKWADGHADTTGASA